MDNFNKATVGYFNIILDNDIVLRLNITRYYKLFSELKAVIVLPPNESTKRTNNLVVMKTFKNKLLVAGSGDYCVPVDENTGLVDKYDVMISTGAKVSFYANGYKYFAICELFNIHTAKPVTGIRSLTFPADEGASILDSIEVFKLEIMQKLEPVKEVVEPKFESETPATNPPAPAVQTSFKVESEFTRAKIAGVDCWAVPRYFSGNAVIKIAIKTQHITARIATRALDGTIKVNNIHYETYAKMNPAIQVNMPITHFWLVDGNEELIDFDIESAKISN
ncbi:hypothetical protein F-LCD7_0149 [Faustovirus]|nr:hypothetical protein F-LCD7_0149 [Faustovirus]